MCIRASAPTAGGYGLETVSTPASMLQSTDPASYCVENVCKASSKAGEAPKQRRCCHPQCPPGLAFRPSAIAVTPAKKPKNLPMTLQVKGH